jgi:3-deoxy-7-phosphoheptulonate synthase
MRPFTLIAGPCAVESREQTLSTAHAVRAGGAVMLRGGAYKLDAVLEVADVIQIGARNMQNATLLTEAGRSMRPVLLKRGAAATLDDLRLAAEYVLNEGNDDVTLCERGIRTFEHSTRYTLDVSAVPVLKERTHLPVIVDPSHAAGRRELVRRSASPRWRRVPTA